MTEIPVISGEAVFAAIDPTTAIERTREAFERYARGEWTMPAKVYLDSPPHGDFRAMPALGDGLALLKWVTSFPGNSARGLPVVRGEILLSDAETGEELAVIECSSVTSLRTGAAAAVSAQVLARRGREVGRDHRLRRERRLGGALPGGRRLRAGCLRRSASRPRRGTGGGARLARRRPRRGSGPGRRRHGDARRGAGDPRGRSAPGPAPRGARRRRPRQAGGRPRSRSSAAASSATSGSRRAPAASSPTRSTPD